MTISKEQIARFQSLFKGREDIYARRWEDSDRDGYMPAYNVDWNRYEKHKALGGTFRNFKHKEPAPLTPAAIRKHLSGKETIGIYPLLKDNTSLLLAADFDKDNWMEESHRFLEACDAQNLAAYLERSRSGNGGHVWLFFQEAYSARKSRKIAFHLLREANILSEFEKDASFDRLFPNQDYHSGKGFGNLIALPLNRKWMAAGNTCFIDPETRDPYSDQWKFLKEVQKVSISRLDQIYNSISEAAPRVSEPDSRAKQKLNIILNDQVWLNRAKLSPTLVNYIREQLNFLDSDYLMKKKLGRSTWKTERYFNLIKEQEDHVIIPRGFLPDLMGYCREHKITYNI